MSLVECVNASHNIVGSKLFGFVFFSGFFFFYFILFISASSLFVVVVCCLCVCVRDTVVSIYSAYCLLLFYGLC